jgi:predicted Zn-dependent protease
MRSINVITINREPKNERDLVKIVEEARRYFPTETWDDVIYLGKLGLEHDVKIATSGESFGALLFGKLIKRIKRIKDSDRLMSLLLGITPDPVVAAYYFFDGKTFKRALYLVHDYVTEKVGIVSFFRLNKETSSKVVAHGLGHNRGLRHHVEPIDLMYSELLRLPILQVEGFCKVCLRMLTKAQTDTARASFEVT